jgi:hypothetical protein
VSHCRLLSIFEIRWEDVERGAAVFGRFAKLHWLEVNGLNRRAWRLLKTLLPRAVVRSDCGEIGRGPHGDVEYASDASDSETDTRRERERMSRCPYCGRYDLAYLCETCERWECCEECECADRDEDGEEATADEGDMS